VANQDSFIDEVNEEVRRDRLFRLFRRYGWIAILAVVIIVAGAAWNEWRKASARAEAEARGDAVLEALSEQVPETRRAAFSSIASGDTPDTAALLQLLSAGADLDAGNVDEAAAALSAVSSEVDVSAVYRDLAILKSVMSGGAGLSSEEKIEQLQGLALPGAPFRLLAQEQIALAEIERGNKKVAAELLAVIAEDITASQGLRNRAIQMIVALGEPPVN